MSSRREENMFRRLSVMLLVSVVFAFPAVAQALDPVHPDTFLYTAQTVLLILGIREFRGEVQRDQEKRIWTSFPSSAWMAWNGVLKPRHLRGVRLAVRTISWMS